MNNSFTESICNICGLELASLAGGCKYSVFDGKAAAVEGHKGIAEYSDTTVSFYVNKGKLSVCGEKLKIKCLNRNFAVVEGDIQKVEVTKNEK